MISFSLLERNSWYIFQDGEQATRESSHNFKNPFLRDKDEWFNSFKTAEERNAAFAFHQSQIEIVSGAKMSSAIYEKLKSLSVQTDIGQRSQSKDLLPIELRML